VSYEDLTFLILSRPSYREVSNLLKEANITGENKDHIMEKCRWSWEDFISYGSKHGLLGVKLK